ncbi:hypothetical protein RchiOBHm_Chr7g0230111 [Rosa chinensis]|uniref:Uncharacterized protein n=1 Tax=Rosa chinensis TaxID=74649 RepID=A0A2P6PFB3_ROSCH|nr:hypothetical protein RchiOBHm_Chr7g0230111 [Rosa chinensis]
MNEYEVRMINGRRALVFATEDSGRESGSKKRTRDMADDQSMAAAAGNGEDSASSHKAINHEDPLLE